jgi:beta-phosphoglucomutase
MEHIKGLIFDLDGVLVDTAKYHFLAWRRMANALGFDFNEHQNEQLKGVSRKQSLALILSWGGITLSPADFEKYMRLKNDWYLEFIQKMQPDDALPGAEIFLRQCKAAGYKIALGSASKNSRLILDKLQFTHFFDAIIDGNVATESKPNPQVFLLGAKALGLTPNQCLVFEDAIAGIQAAHNGGMLAVGIGQPEILTQAEVVYPGLDGLQIAAILNELKTFYKA